MYHLLDVAIRNKIKKQKHAHREICAVCFKIISYICTNYKNKFLFRLKIVNWSTVHLKRH